MKTIYALLVGIDNYPAPVPKLGGAVKDVHKIKDYLEKNFSDRPIHIKTLLEKEATRENFLDGFKNHLGQAKENDVIWFHYSGHGSRQTSAPEFFEVNSGKKDETLVLYDSRPDGNDFADKELAVLLAELSETKAHILVSLDSCHSGAGTRSANDFVKRLSTERPDKRTLDSYMNGYYKTKGLTVPDGKYIFLAACNRFQSAKESFDGGGLFTQNLIDTLNQSGKDISYADLMVRLRQGVVSMKWDQDPQLELSGETDSYTRFLDGSEVDNIPKYPVTFSEDNGWIIEGGQIFGISDNVKIALYKESDIHTPVVITEVSKSRAQNASIENNDKLEKTEKYYARLLSAPDIPFSFGLKVDNTYHSAFIEEAKFLPLIQYNTNPTGDEPFTIRHSDENFEVFDKNRNEVILKATKNHPNAIPELVIHLNQIVTWTRLFNLQNNKTNLSPSVVNIELEIEGKKYTPGVIELKNNGGQLPFKLMVQNKFTQPLHFALLYLSEQFGVVPLKNEPIEVSDTNSILFWGGNEKDYFTLPEGMASSTDTFLFIISTERTDDFKLQLKDMEFGKIELSQRLVPGLSRPTKVKGEWFTNRFVVKLTR